MKKKSKVSKKKSVPISRNAVVKNSFKVQPLGDRIVVKPEEAMDEKSPFGIIIPDTARKEKPERGVVVAVGEGKRNERGDVLPMSVKVGDTVMFSKYGFDEVKIDDVEYYIVSEPSILAVIK
ncbi:MAG TPA: co-chaperone GroES [Candidatus Paceibacterota bacterium]|nr:co-chaperone GroES [Candidatus Paceibacterota bacterium]